MDKTRLDFEKIIAYLIALTGIILSLIQFFYNRSIWLDEANLALNIIHKNFLELLKPLDYEQVSPILFLLLEKLFSTILPDSEYGLRLFPLLSYCFSIYFFYKLLRLTINKPNQIIFALSLFVFNSTLILYSSEVKQYMCDVLVSTSLYYLLLRSYKKTENQYYLLGIAGSISIFLSNAAPIILFSCGVYLLYEYIFLHRKNFRLLAGISFIWIITFLIYYFSFIHEHPAKEFMVLWWSDADSFMPVNPFSIEFYEFILAKSSMLSRSLFQTGMSGKYLLPILIFIGAFIGIRRKGTNFVLLMLLPLLMHLLFSAFKLYPFDLRFVLYALPFLMIIISFTFDYLTDLLFSCFIPQKVRLLAMLIPLLFSLVFFRPGFPRQRQEIIRSINYIQRNMDNADKIYVFHAASRAFMYYTDIQYIKLDMPVIIGSNFKGDKDKNIAELMDLEGKYWLLFVHLQQRDDKYIREKLKALGFETLDSYITFGSSTFLYDFKN